MRIPLLCGVALLTGCGSVSVTQVNQDGKKCAGEPGFYIPRLTPYLVVADLPPDPTPVRNDDSKVAGHHAEVAKAPAGGDQQNKTSGSTPDKSSASGGSTSDFSFSAITKQYVIKLVYLPDYSHQQAIQASPGWFGKSSLQVQLQDGSVTSLSANADNTENGELVKAALTAAITAASGGAAGPAAAAAGAIQGEHAQLVLPPPQPAPTSLLHPGLYRLDYSGGRVTGVTRVTSFDDFTGTAKGASPADTCTPALK